METNKLVPKRRFKEFEKKWTEGNLGDFGTVEMNKRIFKWQTSIVGDVPFYKIGTFGQKANAFISYDIFNEYKLKYPYPNIGDILISASGSIGRTVEYNGEDAYFQDSNIVWLKHNGKLNNLFLKQFYKIIKWNGLEGSTIQRLYNKDILETNINIPRTYKEQQKIGEFFKILDERITIQERKIVKVKALKSAYLTDMFPQEGEVEPRRRFNGFEGKWQEKSLKDFRDESDAYSYTGGPFGSDLKTDDYTKTGTRIIQLQNIGDGYFSNEYKIYTSKEKAASLSSNLIFPEDIIIAKMAEPLARAAILPYHEEKYLMASDGIRLKVDKNKFDNYFILTLINHDNFRTKAIENSTGTTRKRIGLVTLGNLSSYVPELEEQQKIGEFFKNLNAQITTEEKKLEKLKKVKEAYLEEMFV
ncbi:restriction endonuclease subunit S [Rossellomorea vietnamensis]|uniref:Restriction endonuclease subunit S n=1 Tax=Rossellomorea vietnamensis TaxID=218284 RepID=A0A5D4NYM7_9BACI|nr:restriction endonuclease subunit S [Rossellomorea vietnamensis]TYS18486.1 restriction endonuclease subunit S [Rossellomorea vietnamensis]